MNPNTEHDATYLRFNAADLLLKSDDVIRYWGRAGASVDEFSSLIDETIKDACAHMNIQAGFRIRTEMTIHEAAGTIQVGSRTLHPGSVIVSQLGGVHCLAIFVCTLGEQFDAWSKPLFQSEDPLTAFTVDTVGSLAVEAVADRLTERVAKEAASRGMGITNRFSPGYCGWDVAEQHRLFEHLPNHFCGVGLTESAFMDPVKSISGIIGLGREAVKQEYPCYICTRKECRYRGLSAAVRE